MTAWETLNEHKLRDVHPELARRARAFLAAMFAQRVPILITQGLRTWAEQDALYAKGRSTTGLEVTKARGGYSWHNFGLAIDVCPDNSLLEGLQLDWDESHPVWQQIISGAESFDLASGSKWRTFKDWPHLYPKELPPTPGENVRVAFRSTGLVGAQKLYALEVRQYGEIPPTQFSG